MTATGMAVDGREELAAEWRALGSRDYAEEGIPMIVGIETVGGAPPRGGEPAVADEFGALAQALAGADKAKPATILEMVAARALAKLGDGA